MPKPLKSTYFLTLGVVLRRKWWADLVLVRDVLIFGFRLKLRLRLGFEVEVEVEVEGVGVVGVGRRRERWHWLKRVVDDGLLKRRECIAAACDLFVSRSCEYYE